MNRIVSLAAIVLSSHVFTYAQGSHTPDSLISEKSRALQFQIGDKFILRGFQGATLSYKHHTQRSRAWRFGVTLTYTASDAEDAASSFVKDVLSTIERDTETATLVTMQLGAQRMWYAENLTGVYLYGGGGPAVSWSRLSIQDETRTSTINITPPKSSLDLAKTQWAVGVYVFLGAEWFATKAISFHAEYGLSVNYTWAKGNSKLQSSTSGSYTTSDVTESAWVINNPGVMFGLSAYF